MWWKFEQCSIENRLVQDQYWNKFNQKIEQCLQISKQQYDTWVNFQQNASKNRRVNLQTSVPLTFKYRYKYTKEPYKEVRQTPDILNNLKIFFKNNANSFQNSNSITSYLKGLSYNYEWLDNFVSNIWNALQPFVKWNLQQWVKNLFSWAIPWDTPEVQKSLSTFTNSFKNDYRTGTYTLKTVDSFNAMCLLFSYQLIWKKFDKDRRYDWSEKTNWGNKTWNNFQENQKKRELTNKELYNIWYHYKDALLNYRYKVIEGKLYKYLWEWRELKTGNVNMLLYSKKSFYLEKSDISIKKIYYIPSLKSKKPAGWTALLDYCKSKLSYWDVIILIDEAVNKYTWERNSKFYENRGFIKYINEDKYEFCFYIEWYSKDKMEKMTKWELNHILSKAELTW